MSSIGTTEALPGQGAAAARPYAPSWVDQLTDVVRRLPVPAWLFYLGLAVGLALLYTAVKWSDGTYPVGAFLPYHLLSVVGPIYTLALIHYLDDWAGAALDRFRPVMSLAEADYQRLRYQFTTLPARPTFVALFMGGVYGLLTPLIITADEIQRSKLFTSPLASVFDVAGFVLGYSGAALLIYHMIRQLRMVSRIYTTHTRADLFQLRPWYALAELAARTAIGFGLLVYAWSWVNLGSGTSPSGLVEASVFSLIIGLAFIWPLLGAHRLLQQEKERLQSEAAQRLKAILTEINRHTDAGNFAAIAGANEALESMLKQQTVLDKIPTWPWQAETVRGLAAALLLPIVIWFITYVLEHLIKL